MAIGQEIQFEDLGRYIAAMGEAVANAPYADLWRDELKEIALAGQAENFVMQADPSGTPWQLRRYHGDPIRDRGRSGIPGHPILTDLGDLFDSIVNEGAANHIETAIGNEFSTGTNIPYAWEHEYGEGQAQRSFIGISDEFIDQMEIKVADFVTQILVGV